MNYLIAKTKGRNSARYRILSQEANIYEVPFFDNVLAYMDDYKLEDGQWFVVENFRQQTYCLDFLHSHFDATAYSPLPRDEYPNLIYICAVQDVQKYCFQKITSTKVFQKRMITFRLDGQPSILDSEYLIVLNPEPDAVYDAETDKFYFRNLSTITSIFTGIDELYREATDNEAQDFLNLDLLQVDPNYTLDKIKTANRRRIKAAMEKYKSFTQEQRLALPAYLREYCPELSFDENTGRFCISREKEATALLNALNQRYYTTAIDGERRLAHSVTVLR